MGMSLHKCPMFKRAFRERGFRNHVRACHQRKDWVEDMKPLPVVHYSHSVNQQTGHTTIYKSNGEVFEQL
ncbi:hypothetical protein [Kordiimonas sp. SCSIO 12610]|uniref:hypothetical protein n=1 Tax=Kordiimonas sp. SCSIO 12610 TaxID=2829597 RepID=UPI00210A43BA|nr:hypothetical protein [Kordiimonas sp. SCSIO 12610]UTW53955.1 hypothetical protein KFF44_08885 [Kordiimonas sp. SCSIO 12610]